RRGRSADRDASQNGPRGQSDDARQNQKERVYWHRQHQPQSQSNSRQPQYSNSQNQYQNSQNQPNSNFQNQNQNSYQQNNSNFQNRNNQTERGGQQMFSTPNHQGVSNPNPNPNQSAARQEQVSPLHRAVNFADEYNGDEEGDSEGGRGHQGYRNQNPPTPSGYGNESVGGNGFYDERDDRYESDNAQRGQAKQYQGNPNHTSHPYRHRTHCHPHSHYRNPMVSVGSGCGNLGGLCPPPYLLPPPP
ncbi:MAG: hypothetical protein GY821_00655, partial [Gammaproteobacteria bacterium]|nr:hypothetical protein [Gammaproteobacteria bacterium]